LSIPNRLFNFRRNDDATLSKSFLNGKIDNKPNAYIIPFHTKGRRVREKSEGKRDKQAMGRGKERER
jgi:hypothetical protein